MDIKAFTQALESLTAMPQEFRVRASVVAELLTDDQRSAFLGKLSKLHAKLLKDLAAMEKAVGEQAEQLKTAERQFTQLLRHEKEEAAQEQDVSAAEQKLDGPVSPSQP